MRLAEAGARGARRRSRVRARSARAAPTRPDLVIVDCALGPEATNRLAQAARAAGTPKSLVLFSPFERRAFGQTSLKGFDGWLVKPVRARSLYRRLAAAFPARRGRRAGRPERARAPGARRRGQRHQRAHCGEGAAPARFRGRPGGRRRGGRAPAAPAARPRRAVRTDPDGPENAGDRRPRGDPARARAGSGRRRPSDADHRPDRQRTRRRAPLPSAGGFDAFLVKPFEFEDLPARSRGCAARRIAAGRIVTSVMIASAEMFLL